MLRSVSRGHVRLLTGLVLAAIAGAPDHIAAQSPLLVAAGSTWRYLDDGSNQATAWRARAYDDSAWSTGPAQLGYGDGDEATVISYGGNASAKNITTYFRRTFSVTDPSAIGSLTLRLLADDGAVVYVNGLEAFRANMPGGSITSTTLASTTLFDAAESTFVSAAISPGLLVSGTNVIAVEVHQSEPSSSDLSFDLELSAGTSAAITRGPYLQLGTSSGVTVRWRTSAAVIGRVQVGPSPGVATSAATESSPRTDHEVRVSGLLPDSLYYYSVGTTTGPMAGDATFRFRTSPVTGVERPTRVWVVGDSGTANDNVRAVRDAYSTFSGSRDADLWLMLGDNAYNDGLDHEYQAAVFNMFPELLRKTVLWPAYGNHDGYGSDAASNTGPYYDIFTLPKQGEAGGVASGTEAYYSFDYANIHFIALESFETDRSPNGAMLTWLRRDLAANTQPWVIAFFHHPPYSKGSHDSDAEVELIEMRQNALPVLESFGVDLVLAGHSHSYERSYLLDSHYSDSSTFTASMKRDAGSGRPDAGGAYQKPTYGMAPREGTVYVVAGVAGQISGGALNHPAMYTSQSVLGSVVLDVTGNRLDAAFLDSAGSRRDYFTIVKGGGGSAPGTGPFGGTAAAVPGTIEAERFDEGGQSIAYFDSTAGNARGEYRATDVDIEATSDAGGGFNLAKTRAGEWLKYTVNVTATGTYTLEARVANVGAGARFHVEIDGVDRTGGIAVPDTGGWQSWQTVTLPGMALSAGEHVIRLSLDAAASSGGAGNFNWLRFVSGTSAPPSPAYGGTPAALPGIVQIENFDEGALGTAYNDASPQNSGGVYRATAVDIGPTNDPSSGGFYVGWTRAGEWLEYTVNATQSRTYGVNVRVANLGSGAAFRIEIDGVDRTGAIAVPNTGGWDTWQTITAGALSIEQGLHVVRLVMLTANRENAGVGNFGFLQFQ
jgi:hypothetical protein